MLSQLCRTTLGSSQLNLSQENCVMCSHLAETESAQTLERRISVAAAKRAQGMCQGLMSLGTRAVVGPIISIPTVCFMTGKESGELMCAR